MSRRSIGGRRLSEAVRPDGRVLSVTHLMKTSQHLISSDSQSGKGSLTGDANLVVTNDSNTAEVLAQAKRKLKVFVNASCEEVVKMFNVNPELGLSTSDAAERLRLHGPNELEKDPPTPLWKMFLEQFSDILVILLLISCIISASLGEYPAAIFIFIIVMANATLGVVQESRAGAALDALQSLSAPHVPTLRDGKIVDVDSAQLVPGDIIILETGCKISADVRLIDSQGFLCNESSLTGESEPVKKDHNFIGVDNPEAEAPSQVPQSNDPKEKKKEETLTEKNMAYMGCAVQDGRGKGIVVKTGMLTKMGEIADLLKNADEQVSPLQQKLESLGVKLGLISIFFSTLVFIVGITTGRGARMHGGSQPLWLQMLLLSVSLTVAAVPEGLPACVTICLAVGMRQMVKKNALIRNLHSVETLGSASIICSDKTGTLTKGQMTAVRLWYRDTLYRISGLGYEPKGDFFNQSNDIRVEDKQTIAQPLVLAALCSNAALQFNDEAKEWQAVGNISERPLVVAAKKADVEAKFFDVRRIKENPFASLRKMMSVLIDCRGDANTSNRHFGGAPFVSVVKGAPNIVLQNSQCIVDRSGNARQLTQADRDGILGIIDTLSEQAFRVLAVAYQPFQAEPQETGPEALECNLVLVGLIASIDPERDEVADSILKARNAGVRTVMITGDYVKTAKAIAENIGLLPRGSPANKAVDCAVLRDLATQLEPFENELNDKATTSERKKELQKIVETFNRKLDAITVYADVYARAKPSDKITIVRSLQRQGNVCSMTGDGVNDAPALKQADIGVAMGITGTDVAKASADMVLTDDNFCSIVSAIEEGRTIYANISKFVFFLLSTNSAEVLFIFLSVCIGLQTPLEALQILWLNLASDGAPAIALAIEHTEPNIMNEGPRPKTEPLIERIMITGMAIHTSILLALLLSTYIVGLYWNCGTWDGKYLAPGVDGALCVRKAQTMVILEIVFAELFRSYGCRSLRRSVFELGLFSNYWMQWAVGVSFMGTIFVTHCPGIREIFGCEYLGYREYLWVFLTMFIPFIGDECLKVVYRRTGFGERPKVATSSAASSNGSDSVLPISASANAIVPAPVSTSLVGFSISSPPPTVRPGVV